MKFKSIKLFQQIFHGLALSLSALPLNPYSRPPLSSQVISFGFPHSTPPHKSLILSHLQALQMPFLLFEHLFPLLFAWQCDRVLALKAIVLAINTHSTLEYPEHALQ